MGDRANIVVRQNKWEERPPVFLYTHWSGYDLWKTLQTALAKRWRWDDQAYLTRIIMNEMQGDDHGETGYGISTDPPDNSYPYLVVDVKEQKVYVTKARYVEHFEEISFTFEEYLELDKDPRRIDDEEEED